jgi:CRISPR-associated protein Csd1
MILHALNSYYQRLSDEGADIPPKGFSSEKISFCVTYDKDGNFVDIQDIRDYSEKKPFPKIMTVPTSVSRTGKQIKSFLLWDKPDYAIGFDTAGQPDKALEKFECFADKNRAFCDEIDIDASKSFCKFMNNWDPSSMPDLKYKEDLLKGGNIVFKLDGDIKYLHEYDEVKQKISEIPDEEPEKTKGMCLITGEEADIARLHPVIKGVQGAQTSGASIVSFNQSAFESYNKSQSYNSPVSKDAVFNYTTVLNHLLSGAGDQKFRIGDTTFVFWSEKKSKVESMFGQLFGGKTATQDTADNEIKLFLESARKGKSMPDELGDGNLKFFILGLSPNAARLSIRFWLVDSIAGIHEKIGQHMKDCDIELRHDKEVLYPTIWQILRETALERKSENIPPIIEGSFTQAVLTGGLYPQSLYNKLIGRIRADREITHTRMYAVKGYLNRKSRILNKNTEVTVSLDKENKDIAYLLGRLFAVLEKTQTDAIKGANTTIKDRFYGAASSTPSTVFPMLLRLSQHHIEKSDYGRISDMRIQEIMENIEKFPKVLNLTQQGSFALGYYHQKNDFYKKNDKEETDQ